MAAATLTVTANVAPNVSARSNDRGGVTAVSWSKNSGTVQFGTATDVMLLAKLPNGARILDHNTVISTKSTTTHWKLVAYEVSSVGSGGTLGTLSEISDVMGSFTVAAAGVVNLQGPRVFPKISLSDAAAVQFAVLGLKCGTGASASTSFLCDGNVIYETNGNDI